MAARKKAYHANCWGPLGGNAVGVTSITQLTYRTFGDIGRAIAEIGEVGYDGVELFDGNLLDYENDAATLRASLSGAGVKLLAAYSGANFVFPDILEEELARIRRVADTAAEFGAEHLVVGGGAKRADGLRADDFAHLAEGLEKVVELARARGLTAHYHPHLSTIVEGPEEVRKIFGMTSIDFCPDTAHLAAAAAIRRDDPRTSRANFLCPPQGLAKSAVRVHAPRRGRPRCRRNHARPRRDEVRGLGRRRTRRMAGPVRGGGSQPGLSETGRS